MDDIYTKHRTQSIPIVDNAATPARKSRHNQTPRKARQEDLEWTVIRCQRLLRSLTSRIAILRRLSENDFATQFQRTPKAKRKRDVFADPVEKLGCKLATMQTPSRGDDPEWFPGTEEQKPGRTYRGRGRPKKGPSKLVAAETNSRPDDGFRTPYIKRLLRPEALLSPAEDAYSTTSRIGHLSKRGRQDAIQPNSHAERALRTLLDAYDNVLDCTDPQKASTRRGASSLLSMCIKKMPAYIDFEQKWAEEEDGNYDFDALDTIYSELAALGRGSWPGLREVCRAHAVRLVLDAMQERMWPLKSVDALINICIKHNAIAEGQQLLKTWLVYSKGKIEGGPLKFVELCIGLDQKAFMLQCLGDSLSTGSIGCAELTSMTSLWQEVPLAFARRSSRLAAAGFLLKYAIVATARLSPGTAVGSDGLVDLDPIITVLTLITTMCIAHGAYSDFDADNMPVDLQRLALQATSDLLYVEEHADSDAARTIGDYFRLSSILLYASQSAAQMSTSEDASVLLDLVRRNNDTPDPPTCGISRERAAFLCKIARTLHSVGHVQIIEQLIRYLESVGRSTKSRGVNQLAVDVAMQWAEHCDENAAYTRAEELQERMLSSSPEQDSLPTIEAQETSAKYRWAEGIEEWVAATPCVQCSSQRKVKRSSLESQDSGIGMSESDTPNKASTEHELQSECEKLSAALLSDFGGLPAMDGPPLAHVDVLVDVEGSCNIAEQEQVPSLDAGGDFEHPATPCARQRRKTTRPKRRSRPRVMLDDEDEDEKLHVTTEAGVTREHSHQTPPSSSAELHQSLPAVKAVDRDELAMTPGRPTLPCTPAPKKRARPRKKPVEATPARMVLRSQRKASKCIGAEDVSEDELGL